MFLKSALNALTRLHSRQALLKRLGTVDIYSPCRITPSNYFRNLRGPEYTTIKGVEFIIPVDTLTGQFAQKLSFPSIPDAGTFKILFGLNLSGFLAFNASALDIQTELRLIPELINVVVTGSFLLGFTITFVGFQASTGIGQVTNSTLLESGDPVDDSWVQTFTLWGDKIKKGDRIVDGTKQWAIDEVVEMHDLGAEVMAFRCRSD